MPPFPQPISEDGLSQPEHHNRQRRSVSSSHADSMNSAKMAHPLLKPRSSETLSLALAPLEPLYTFDDSTAGSAHLTLESRDISHPSSSQQSHQLSKRALNTNVIPLSYNLSGAKPGVVVGATLGAVAAFILLMWIITVFTTAGDGNVFQGEDIEEEVRVHRHRHSDRSRRSRRTRQMSERGSAPPPPRRRERILVEETRRTERSRPPPPPVEEEREVETERHDVEVEEERRVSGDDVVEVIEEQSDITPEPPRRKKSGYRTVDPNAYGGGSFPQREVYDDRRRSSRRHGR